MKQAFLSVLCTIGIVCLMCTGCKKKEEKLKYEYGVFPDSIYALAGINSEFDDYNVSVAEQVDLNGSLPLLFSSNRKTEGGSFDFVYGRINYSFNRMTGDFSIGSTLFNEDFYETLTGKFNTEGNDYGPNRLFCSLDGYEYMFGASEVAGKGLDLKFSRYTPYISSTPSIPDPVPAAAFNSSSNDAYVCFNRSFDTAYFCSDRGGNFDIYMVARPNGTAFQNWITAAVSSPVQIQGVNTESGEKCPYISGRIMVFTSNREGGSGGWDLYYSVLSDGVWGTPVNMGAGINTQYNEYRPVIGIDNTFENRFIIFSSDRPTGKGGFDLYFTCLKTE